MPHVFAEKPDSRQSDDQVPPRSTREEGLVVSRFRPTYRALSEEEKELHDEIKSKAHDLEILFMRVKAGRYNSLAMTALEQSIMWIIKALTDVSAA